MLSAGLNSILIEAQRICCAIAMISSLRIHLRVTPSKQDASLSPARFSRLPIRPKVKMSEGQGERGGELVASLLPPLTSTGAVEAVACSASPRLKGTLDVCIIFVAERGYPE